MANIQINKKEFENLVGREFTDEELSETASFLGAHWNPVEDGRWDVEVYPNRPDLLSVEGLARAYRGFFGLETGLADYGVRDGDLEVEVDDSVEEVRPFIGGAVVRGLDLDRRAIDGLIQLQEKLHETFGRKRDKLAIGLHDLEAVEEPFTYKAVEPEKVSFKPLEYDREMELGEIIDEHEKGQEYAWILEDEDRYPVIVDSRDRVLSFPPIINNQLTEVTTGTQDVFIDVTGKDRETVLKALNIMATALAERGGSIETVRVDGTEMPDLDPEPFELDPDYFRSVSGVELEDGEIVERLEQMRFGAEMEDGGILVKVPAYRTDIMHQYDLIEDTVIAHGYDEIDPEMPEIDQVAEEKDIEDFTAIVRDVMQGTGALETHTYVLSNREKLFERMDVEPGEVASMSNALTQDYTVARNWLLPSLMNALKRNRHRGYPQRFFEAAEVVERDDSSVGASNRRKLAYVVSDSGVDYTDAKEVLQALERDLGVGLEVKEGSRNCFRDGRAGNVYLEGEKVGVIGEFSPGVVDNWSLERPVAGFELDLEKVMDRLGG